MTSHSRQQRNRLPLVLAVVFASALWAGLDGVMNPHGWDSFTRFWRAALSPELDPEFLRLAFDASLVTIAYAVLGTVLSIVIGLALAPILSKLGWGLLDPGTNWRGPARVGWFVARGLAAVPRAAHEIVWGLALVQIFGLNPMVAVLAIGMPFGLVTAKVYGDALDHAPLESYRILRAQGGRRAAAMLTAVIPVVRLDLAAYGFYRFECAIRSAAILGIIGAGGLGFQLSLSFQTLKYHEVWTLIWALVLVSGLADLWSTKVRRATSGAAGEGTRTVALSAAGLVMLTPLSWWWVELDLSILWSNRTSELAQDLATRAWPPSMGRSSWGDIARSSVDTVTMSVLAIAIAVVFSTILAFIAGGALRHTEGSTSWMVTVAEIASRAGLLLARAVPPPVWAFVVVLIVLPGTWPGAIALGLYNLGVLGRLQAEVVENEISDARDRPTRLLIASGASAPAAFLTATLPRLAPRFEALSIYRWEVALRETMVVGVVGASGLGRDLNQQLAGRAFDQALMTLLVLVLLTIAIDGVGATLRRSSR